MPKKRPRRNKNKKRSAQRLHLMKQRARAAVLAACVGTVVLLVSALFIFMHDDGVKTGFNQSVISLICPVLVIQRLFIIILDIVPAIIIDEQDIRSFDNNLYVVNCVVVIII